MHLQIVPRAKTFFSVVVMLGMLCTLAGCAHGVRLTRNEKSGREIEMALEFYSTSIDDANYPEKLDTLVSARVLKSLPQCKCEDGIYRDFIYIPGHSSGPTGRWVILLSPPEMAPDLTLVVYTDRSSEFMSKAKAITELQRTKVFLSKQYPANQ